MSMSKKTKGILGHPQNLAAVSAVPLLSPMLQRADDT
jgi:hypothetical protein